MQDVLERAGLPRRYAMKIVERSGQFEKRHAMLKHFFADWFAIDNIDAHLPVFRQKKNRYDPSFSLQAEQEARSDGGWSPANWTMFCNFLRAPAYGPTWDRSDPDYSEQFEPPSERAIIGPHWFFTLEWDPPDVAGLIYQLDWIWKRTSGNQTSLAIFDRELRARYRDYRGFSVVFTGNKSLHIHLIFETSWLNRAAIEAKSKVLGRKSDHDVAKHYDGDIRQDAIWRYYRLKSIELAETFKRVTGVDVPFDPGMHTLSQKRRLGWGTRLEDKDDNILGFKQGDRIQQVVLEESIMTTSPKGTDDYFLRSAEANAIFPTASSSRAVQPSASLQTRAPEDELIACLQHWMAMKLGDEFPRASHFASDGGVHFFNHPDDQHPNTYVGPDFNKLAHKGRHPINHDRLPLGLTLAETLTLLDAGSEEDGEGSVDMGPPSPPALPIQDRIFYRRMAGPTGPRGAVSSTSDEVLKVRPHVCVVSVEGVGKSHAILTQATRYRIDDGLENFFRPQPNAEGEYPLGLTPPSVGLHLFASSSYAQAEEQLQNYVRCPNYDAAQECRAENCVFVERRGVLLKSFSRYYDEYISELDESIRPDQIRYESALRAGFSSMIDAVFHQQPEIYREITRRKNEAWAIEPLPGDQAGPECGFRKRFDTIVFTTHTLAQELHQRRKSTAWLHPDFDFEQDSEDYSALSDQMRAYRIIHDEAAIDDLVWRASEEEVAFAASVKEAGPKPWSELSIREKFAAFHGLREQGPEGIGFSRVLDLIEAGFADRDRFSVDFDLMPFGRDNHENGIYNGLTGNNYYLKPKTWWRDSRARVVFLTTERLPATIIRKLSWSAPGGPGQHGSFAMCNWDRERFFAICHHRLKIDPRACKGKIDELVNELVGPESDQVDTVISDMVRHPSAISHRSAQGRNDLKQDRIATVLTFLGPEQYAMLNVLGQWLQDFEVVPTFYRDRVNQALGRNSGMRGQPGNAQRHVLIMSPTLLHELGGRGFIRTGRYRFDVVSL